MAYLSRVIAARSPNGSISTGMAHVWPSSAARTKPVSQDLDASGSRGGAHRPGISTAAGHGEAWPAHYSRASAPRRRRRKWRAAICALHSNQGIARRALRAAREWERSFAAVRTCTARPCQRRSPARTREWVCFQRLQCEIADTFFAGSSRLSERPRRRGVLVRDPPRPDWPPRSEARRGGGATSKPRDHEAAALIRADRIDSDRFERHEPGLDCSSSRSAGAVQARGRLFRYTGLRRSIPDYRHGSSLPTVPRLCGRLSRMRR